MPDQEDLLLKSAKVNKPAGTSFQKPAQSGPKAQDDLLTITATGGGSKKKESSEPSADGGGQPASTPTSQTTQLLSEVQSRSSAKTFLDQDIDSNFDVAANVSNKKGAFQPGGALVPTIESTTAPAPNGDNQRSEIKSNPEHLKKYYSARLSVLDEKIQQTNSAALEASKEYLGEKVRYRDTPQSIALKKESDDYANYKNELKNAVKKQAAVSVTGSAIAKKERLDPEVIGKQMYEVLGDPTLKDDDKVLAEIKDPSSTFFLNPHGDAQELKQVYDPKASDKTKQNIEYKRYTTGAQAIQDYWQTVADGLAAENADKLSELEGLFQNKTLDADQKTRYDELMKDTQIKSFFDAQTQLENANATQQKAISKFPQVERLQERQKVNNAFFGLNEFKDATGGTDPGKVMRLLFGSTPTKDDIPVLSKMSGVSEKKIQAMLDEGGFFSDIPYSVRISGIFQGLASGAKDTVEKTQMGFKRFLSPESAVTETENRIQQDELNEFNIKADANKLRDDNGNWNINPASIANVMGYGIGQTSIQAIPALLSGGLATEGSLLQKGIEAVSTVVPGAAASYEDAYKIAAANTSDEPTRKAYALLNSLANGAAELLYSPADVIKGISGGLGPKAVFKTFMKDVAKDGLENTVTSKLAHIGKKIWAVGKEPANVLVSENIEEQATNLATNALDENMLGIHRTQAQLADQSFETFIQTTLQTLPMAIGVGIGGNNDMSGIRKQALFEIGKEPDLYKTRLQDLLDKQQITQENFNEKASHINTMQTIVSNLPKTDAAGKLLSYEHSAELAAQQFRTVLNNQKEKGGVLEAERGMIEKDNAEALQRQNEILGTLESNDIPGTLEAKQKKEQDEYAQLKEISDALPTQEYKDVLSLQPIMDQVNNADYVNENDLNNAADKLYSLWDKSPDARPLIEPLIEKLENYDFATKTQVSSVTETVPVEVPRENKRQEIKPAFEQAIGTAASFTTEGGERIEGQLSVKDGNYVITDAEGKEQVVGEKAITDRDLKLPDEATMDNPIEFDEEGNVKSVTFETKDGNLVSVNDPEVALDLAIQLRSEAIGEIPEKEFETVYQQIVKEVKEEVPVKDISSQSKTKTDENSSEKSSDQNGQESVDQRGSEKSDGQNGQQQKSDVATAKTEGAAEEVASSNSETKKSEDNAVQKHEPTKGMLRDEGVQREGELPAVERGNKTEESTKESKKEKVDEKTEVRKPAETESASIKEPAKNKQRPGTTEIETEEGIGGYEMTNSTELNKFMSGDTIESVFGEMPEGDQGYYVQRLTDMLKDGKSMIALAQADWGMDLANYGLPLFKYIQSISNDRQLTNKKAVLLATFLGEIKEEINRNPDRRSEFKPLENAVEAYYQNFMNVMGKSIVAGRLLRLYRDKYLGDIFVNRILEEKQIKDKAALKKIEEGAKVTDEIAEQPITITQEEKSSEDKAQADKIKKDKKQKSSQKKMSEKDATALAASKMEDIKSKSGDVKTFAQEIKDRIDKLNCK